MFICLQVSLKEEEFIKISNKEIPTKDISLKSPTCFR